MRHYGDEVAAETRRHEQARRVVTGSLTGTRPSGPARAAPRPGQAVDLGRRADDLARRPVRRRCRRSIPPTPTCVELARTSAASAASLALNGLVSGTSLGAVVASQLLLLGATAAGLMSTLLVVRHTRAEEEAGRAELIGSAVVGRHAPLTAAVVVGIGANLVLALLVAVGLIGLGLPVQDRSRSAWRSHSPGRRSSASAPSRRSSPRAGGRRTASLRLRLGVAFLLRAAGDAGGELAEAGTRVDPRTARRGCRRSDGPRRCGRTTTTPGGRSSCSCCWLRAR